MHASVVFVRNDGVIAEWQYGNGSPTLTSVGTATPTNDNDGASCGDVSLLDIETSTDTWSPAVTIAGVCDGGDATGQRDG